LLAHHADRGATPAAFVSPLPKFHPVPTRPVFESQMLEGEPLATPFPLGQLQPVPVPTPTPAAR
jgi:hypothetical protein